MQLSNMIGTLLAVALTNPLFAQHADTNEIEESLDDNLIVYGVRLAQPATEVGSSVFIITADEIAASGVNYLLDAIAAAPGVTINQNGGYGGAASVRIRGASSQQTLVIVDGVVVNDPASPGGGFDFSRLDPASVDRIEVLKGPQSTLWGSDAMGGVINIVTKRSGDGFGGDIFAQAGSYGSLRGGASISNGNQRFDFRLAAVQHTTDGISKADKINGNIEDDAYESTSISASGGVQFGDSRVQATLLWTDADTEFDSFAFGAPGNVADGNELSTTEELTASLSLSVPLLHGKLQNQILAGISDIDRASFSGGFPGFASKGDRLSYRYQGTLDINDDNRLAFGAEREAVESNGEDTSINSLFALYELQAADTLTVTAGVRRHDHERFGSEITGRFTVGYNPHEQITLRASWGEAFKAPTLFQTTFFCCGASAPGSDLKPETSDAYDLGVVLRRSDGRGEVGLSYFDQDTTNLIDFSFATGAYENIAIASSTGIELDGHYRVGEWLRASVSYAYIDARDAAGNALIRVPRHSGEVALAANPDGRLSTTVTMRYNGKEQDPSGLVGSWTRLNISGRYTLSDTLDLYARIENLLDRQYQQVIGYGTPGMSGYVGARLSF